MTELMRATGLNESQVIRDALVAARRTRLSAQLRAQARACRDDPNDLADAQLVLREMSERRAW